MSKEKQVVVGTYYNGFKSIIYSVDDFNLETIRDLGFYYDSSVIYFMLMEGNKIKKTIFKKSVLPPEIYYDLTKTENPTPMSMETIVFKLKNLPSFLNATDIKDFDKNYYYDLEIMLTENYPELERAFLGYAKTMIPQIAKMEFEAAKDIISANPFDFAAFNKQSNDEILDFLLAFEYKNPTLSKFISNYRSYVLYKMIMDSFDKKEASSSRRA